MLPQPVPQSYTSSHQKFRSWIKGKPAKRLQDPAKIATIELGKSTQQSNYKILLCFPEQPRFSAAQKGPVLHPMENARFMDNYFWPACHKAIPESMHNFPANQKHSQVLSASMYGKDTEGKRVKVHKPWTIAISYRHLASLLCILRQLVDDCEEGAAFRRFYYQVRYIDIKLLTRGSSREDVINNLTLNFGEFDFPALHLLVDSDQADVQIDVALEYRLESLPQDGLNRTYCLYSLRNAFFHCYGLVLPLRGLSSKRKPSRKPTAPTTFESFVDPKNEYEVCNMNSLSGVSAKCSKHVVDEYGTKIASGQIRKP